jgi:hypothetical protein
MQTKLRFGAICAMLGVFLVIVSTSLHPMHADPNDPVAAFSEYAQDTLWVWSHLIRVAGVFLISVTLYFVCASITKGIASCFAAIGKISIYLLLSLVAILQAVDGIALKNMVDRLASAPPELKPVIFEATFAVRQVEIALASLTSLTLGVTIIMVGFACFLAPDYKRWLACLGIASGIGLFVSGVAIASSGFSALSMNLGMPSNMLAMVWVILLSISLLRSTSAGTGETKQ